MRYKVDISLIVEAIDSERLRYVENELHTALLYYIPSRDVKRDVEIISFSSHKIEDARNN